LKWILLRLPQVPGPHEQVLVRGVEIPILGPGKFNKTLFIPPFAQKARDRVGQPMVVKILASHPSRRQRAKDGAPELPTFLLASPGAVSSQNGYRSSWTQCRATERLRATVSAGVNLDSRRKMAKCVRSRSPSAQAASTRRAACSA